MIRLQHDQLGELEIREDPFVGVSLQVGAPEVRAVTRNRALANGTFDDTRFTGARAITVTVRLNNGRCGPYTTQQLIDRLAPFMAPRRRVQLSWSLPGSSSERLVMVRGEGLPVSVERPRFQTLVLQFIAPNGEITSPEQHCQTISPSQDTEEGRDYDLTFDRTYPETTGIGARLIDQQGNEPAHWQATIFGPVEEPQLRVNDVTIEWPGLVLANEAIVIDTRNRTMVHGADSTVSYYGQSNFADWAWSDLLLVPGENLVRYTASVLSDTTSVRFCWFDTWAA